MISQQLLDELQQILTEDYHIELEKAELADFANTLVTYFDTLWLMKQEGEAIHE